MPNWRLESKFVFLTFSQCDVKKETAMDRIKTSWGDELEWAIVCEEKHKDGSPHIHCLLAHKLRFRTRLQTYFNCIGGKQCNVEGVTRTLAKVVTYVTKAGDYIEYGIDAVEFLRAKAAKRSPRFAIVAALLKAGASVADLYESHGDFVLQHLRKIKEFIDERRKILQDRKDELERIKWTEPIGVGVQDVVIAEWLQDNVFKKRQLGDANLWIYGKTGLGKTRLKEQLMDRVRVYVLPYDSNWFDSYEDGKYDLMVVDEFKCQYTITQMNRLLGSERTTLNRRGKPPLLCRDRLPVLVLSNYDIRGCYVKAALEQNDGLDALARRVNEHLVYERIDITFPAFVAVPDGSTTESVEESPGLKRERETDYRVKAKRVKL